MGLFLRDSCNKDSVFSWCSDVAGGRRGLSPLSPPPPPRAEFGPRPPGSPPISVCRAGRLRALHRPHQVPPRRPWSWLCSERPVTPGKAGRWLRGQGNRQGGQSASLSPPWTNRKREKRLRGGSGSGFKGPADIFQGKHLGPPPPTPAQLGRLPRRGAGELAAKRKPGPFQTRQVLPALSAQASAAPTCASGFWAPIAPAEATPLPRCPV